MQALEVSTLQEELSRRQRALKEIDLQLAEQLARQAVLEQLYEGSSLQQSQNSSSLLNQSSISRAPSSAASVSSSFLKQQIQRVYSFMRDKNADKHMNDTRTRTHLIDPHTQIQIHADQTSPLQLQTPEQWPSSFHKTTTDHNVMANFIHRQQTKMKKLQLQEEREREMVQFLKARQKMRQQSLKQERLQIRQQLLKEQNNSGQSKPQHKISKPTVIHYTKQMQNDDTLKKERCTALSRLLKQVKKGQRQATRLMERTRIASYH